MSIELETRIDQLIRQNAALAAENEKLQVIIDEAKKQEPVGYVVIGKGISFYRTTKQEAEHQAATLEWRDDQEPSVHPVYAAPIPAQQSPTIPSGIYENKCSCGNFFFGVKNQPFCARCYDEKLKVKQSPAVAAPDTNKIIIVLSQLVDFTPKSYEDHTKLICAAEDLIDELKGINQSPRITEHDALAITTNYEIYRRSHGKSLSGWWNLFGRDLLDKLNGDKNVK